jgi:hypothetical protein
MKNILYTIVLVFTFLLLSIQFAFAQTKAIYFNAEWNEDNDIEWFNKLSDVEKEKMDIGSGDCKKKYKVSIVPTIIIFNDGEEIKRFQADLSFKLLATRKEVQDAINEIILSDF